MSDWYVYILKCKDDTLYTGITNNLEKRIDCHKSGKGSKYVRSRLPITLIYVENANNRSEASKREYEIKKLSRTNKLKLINTKNSMDFI